MSAMLYELTAKAAQMCMPVPAPEAAPDWIDLIDHWQTLGGNIVGGVMGIAGALVVAVKMRDREQWIAAGMVLPDLQQLATGAASLEASLPSRLPPGSMGTGLSASLAQLTREGLRLTQAINTLKETRPNLFALHTPVVGQLSDIDRRIYGHLFQCQMAHRRFEDGMTAWTEKPSSPPAVGQLYEDWQRAAVNARLAHYFLDRLVLSRWPRWMTRIRMVARPNALDRESSQLLRGKALKPSQASLAAPVEQEPAGTECP
jgi:hypothetical protein